MLEIASTQGLLDHDTSRAVLVIWTAPSAPLIFYPPQFIWSSVCTHTVHFRKSFLLSPSEARCFCMACSDDSETEWSMEARQLCSSKRDPPGRPAKACQWGWEHVPCCWITLKYCVPLLCLIGSMSALHVWKGSSKVLAPPPTPPPCNHQHSLTHADGWKK